MRRYHFDLVDTNTVLGAGGSLLDHDDQARKAAHGLVLEGRETRPELVGRGYVAIVRSDAGDENFAHGGRPSRRQWGRRRIGNQSASPAGGGFRAGLLRSTKIQHRLKI